MNLHQKSQREGFRGNTVKDFMLHCMSLEKTTAQDSFSNSSLGDLEDVEDVTQ